MVSLSIRVFSWYFNKIYYIVLSQTYTQTEDVCRDTINRSINHNYHRTYILKGAAQSCFHRSVAYRHQSNPISAILEVGHSGILHKQIKIAIDRMKIKLSHPGFYTRGRYC